MSLSIGLPLLAHSHFSGYLNMLEEKPDEIKIQISDDYIVELITEGVLIALNVTLFRLSIVAGVCVVAYNLFNGG